MGTLLCIWHNLTDNATSITAIICETIIIISVINGILIFLLRANQLCNKNKAQKIEAKHIEEMEKLKQEAKKLDELKLYQRQKANFLEKQATKEALNLKDTNEKERNAFTGFVDERIKELTTELNQATSEPRKSLVSFIKELCKRE